jgi:transcriptional regulator with XRE-family HTH domain
MVLHKAVKTEIDLFVIGKVKELRVKNGISQVVLAVKLEVAESFIGAIENPKNRAKYNLSHINKLAAIFDCSPQYFLPETALK